MSKLTRLSITRVPLLFLAAAALGLLVTFLVLRADGQATATDPDPRVTDALDEVGLKYAVDDDGGVHLLFAVGSRTQQVYVTSSTNRYGQLEVREIWSPAWRQDRDAIPVDLANRMLADSFASKLGGWQRMESQRGVAAVFCIKLHADATPEQLRDALQFVSEKADGMERELTNRDEF